MYCYENGSCWPIALVCCSGNGFFCAIGFVVDGDVWDIGVVVCSADVVVAVGLLSRIDC